MSGEDDRSPALLIAVAVVAFPLLRPHGPGHITPADAFMGLAVLGVIVWAGTYRLPVHLPYLIPVAVLVCTGLLAAMFSVDPDAGSLAVVQDVFLFAWAAAIANAIRTPKNLSLILGAWAWGATVWASLLIAGVITHQSWLAGGQDRAQMGFDNPNMAANYFLMSLFVLLLGRQPRSRVARLGACFLILTAIVLTGSNAALLSLALGGATAGLFAVWRRTDLVIAVATASIAVVLLAGLAYFTAEEGVLAKVENSSNALVERSIARSSKSAAGRTSLFADELELFRTGSLLGRGPANTQVNLERSFGQIVKEAHDDYLATLVERGPVGAIGLLILVVGVGVRAFSIVLRPLRPEFARQLRNPSAVVGGAIALAVFATTHEILHYRHVWAFLGILAGLYLFGREMQSDSVPGGPSFMRGGRERA